MSVEAPKSIFKAPVERSIYGDPKVFLKGMPLSTEKRVPFLDVPFDHKRSMQTLAKALGRFAVTVVPSAVLKECRKTGRIIKERGKAGNLNAHEQKT